MHNQFGEDALEAGVIQKLGSTAKEYLVKKNIVFTGISRSTLFLKDVLLYKVDFYQEFPFRPFYKKVHKMTFSFFLKVSSIYHIYIVLFHFAQRLFFKVMFAF